MAERTPQQILETGCAWVTEAELQRLVARIALLEEVLRGLHDAVCDMRATGGGFREAIRAHDVAQAVLAARAALAHDDMEAQDA